MNKNTPSLAQSETRGFTLLELLVVIAIIGIIVSLMIPALHMAKQRAMRTKCASKLRQMYAANTTYSGDHGGQGVYNYTASGGGTVYWFQDLGSYLTGRDTDAEPCGPELRCPAGEANSLFGEEYNEGTWESVDYGLMEVALIFNGVEDPKRTAMFLDTHGDDALMDEPTFTTMMSSGSANVLRHPGGTIGSMNVVFCDGHLEMILDATYEDLVP
ncbi:MAG: prepilin-type N-terminal cleavage/methylation domain-containing protein [Kiritimatiellae bacterium]|nr:prepilin-type N-terminal cleavage/methylation domain-containing protein [Kiritimatiellia bacterium]